MTVSLLPGLRSIDPQADLDGPVRWRGFYREKHAVTLDFAKQPDRRFWLSWFWQSADGGQYQGYLEIPNAGCSEDGKLDWAVVSDWEATCEADACQQAYQSFLQDHACQSLEGLVKSGVVFEPTPHRIDPATRMACLSIERMGGAVWRLWAKSSALEKLWFVVTGSSPMQSLYSSRFATLLSIPIKWRFQIPMPSLTPQQTDQLDVGCLLVVNSRVETAVQKIAVLASTSKLPLQLNRKFLVNLAREPVRAVFRQVAVIAHAALDLRIVRTPLSDQLDFQWGCLQADSSSSGGHAMQNSLATSGPAPTDLHIRLECVIGTRTLSLADVLHLQRGDILKIDDFPLPHVHLLLEGRTVGTGELVRCADALAVQIMEWFDRKEEESTVQEMPRPVAMDQTLANPGADLPCNPTDIPE